MLNYENEIYYTTTDLFHEFENPSSEEFIKLRDKFLKVYKKDSSFWITDSYIQLKLYPAAEKKLIKTLYFKKSDKCKKKFKAWSIKAINDFLDKPSAAHIQRHSFKYELIEAEKN